MSRTNLFFKVEVEHDADENPEKIGNEIRQHLMKWYGVKSVELSHVTTQEE
ncbi:MAG: hypothetical protein LAQ69_19150 [Acidobacteriia bacterium]|nr:hypothetical protein [Terriglobia bacterium]